ncbi:MAG: SemiSWEET transporter [Gluconacetobacter diazotrophicus]|nr:SemiSWEET transporter [Gluconacetobacter diazotrophicus]
MHLDPVGVISLFAAGLSMVSYVPQAWGIIRSRSTDGISLKMYLITVCCFVLWLVYGVLVGQWPIIVQNVICLLLSMFILVMKLLPRKETAMVAAALDPTGAPPEPS